MNVFSPRRAPSATDAPAGTDSKFTPLSAATTSRMYPALPPRVWPSLQGFLPDTPAERVAAKALLPPMLAPRLPAPRRDPASAGGGREAGEPRANTATGRPVVYNPAPVRPTQ